MRLNLIKTIILCLTILGLWRCEPTRKTETNLKDLEIRCKEQGDYDAYLKLTDANLKFNYDILNTSIFVSKKYNWGLAYYMVYESLKLSFNNKQDYDSTIFKEAIYNLNKSVQLNCPQALFIKSYLLLEGRFFIKDTAMSKILYTKYESIIAGIDHKTQ